MIGRLRSDAGSILPLVAGFAALGLTVALLVAAATSLYVEHKRLLAYADGAALLAAETYDLDDVVIDDAGVHPVLTDAGVRATVEAYAAQVPHDFEGLRIESATSEDGRSALVVLSARWSPPVVSLLVPDGLTVLVEARARSDFA